MHPKNEVCGSGEFLAGMDGEEHIQPSGKDVENELRTRTAFHDFIKERAFNAFDEHDSLYHPFSPALIEKDRRAGLGILIT